MDCHLDPMQSIKLDKPERMKSLKQLCLKIGYN